MEHARRMRPLLGTFVEVSAQGPAAAAAVDAALRSLEDSQRRWSLQDEASELSALNRSGGARVPLARSTLRLLRLACALQRRSGGGFDCTVGGLLSDARGRWLPRGTPDDLEIGDGWARLRRPLRITLDGIAKGYAVDRAIAALRGAGAVAGWINAGGDLRVFGAHALPVHRREADGRLTPLGLLRNAAVATSGVRPAGAPPDARHPAEILAPAGRRAAPGCWSVLASSAWRADALTKVAATAPAAQRHARVAELGGRLLA
jgi:FAD:protein FMN transferase